MITEEERSQINQFKAKNALKHIKELCKINDRFAGRPGDLEAADFIEDFYKGLGLETERFPVEIPSFIDNGSRLILDGNIEIKPLPVYFCKAADEGGITADIVYAGAGEEKDYKNISVAGKIAVIDVPRLYLGKYIKTAAENKALALIVINPMEWAFRMGAEAGFSDPEKQFFDEMIPALCVSAYDGYKIMERLGAGRTKAFLTCNTKNEIKKSYMVIGKKTGFEKPEECIGIVAHRDVVVDPGANDNGSGTGTMMELAKLMAPGKYKRTMLFISSTGEEGVTWGSYLYARANEKNFARNMKALFNFDMFAVGGKLNVVDKGYWPDTGWMSHSEWLNNSLVDIADDLGYEIGLMEADWGVSESDRFSSIGVPSIWFWKDGDPMYHTDRDVPENVDGNSLKVVGDVVYIAAGRILNG